MHLNPASTAFISEMFGLPVMNFSFCFEQIKCETAMIWKMDHPKLIWCCVIVKMYSWFTAWQAWWRASVTDLINEKASYKGMDFTSWVNRHRFLSYFFPINLFFSFPASVLGGEKKKSFCLCLFFFFYICLDQICSTLNLLLQGLWLLLQARIKEELSSPPWNVSVLSRGVVCIEALHIGSN